MRATKEDWLNGQGDLKEEDVEDVPGKGQSVRVRALPARFSAEIQSQMRMTTVGDEQIARIDVAAMEALQFEHGVVDPKFDARESRIIQEKYGPGFRKIITAIDRISGIDKEEIEKTEQRFPAGGAGPNGSDDDRVGTPLAAASRTGDESAV